MLESSNSSHVILGFPERRRCFSDRFGLHFGAMDCLYSEGSRLLLDVSIPQAWCYETFYTLCYTTDIAKQLWIAMAIICNYTLHSYGLKAQFLVCRSAVPGKSPCAWEPVSMLKPKGRLAATLHTRGAQG